MLVAEAPSEEMSGLDAAALLSLAPIALTTLQHAPASPALKPNAAFVISLALHAGLAVGILRLPADGFVHGEADLETPIEIIVDDSAASSAERAEIGKPAESNTSEAGESAMTPPAAAADAPTAADAPQAVEAQAAETQAAQATAAAPVASLESSPSTPADVAAPAPIPDAALPAAAEQTRLLEQREEQRAERERRHAAELARQRMQERRKEAARRAEQRAREDERERAAERAQARDEQRRAAARAEERRRVAHAGAAERQTAGARKAVGRPAAEAPAARSRAGDNGAFDASAYRALVARAVRAAVGSRCSQGAGSRVVVALVIGRTGAISSASVTSSSGNSAFDAASAAAVRSAGPFPAPTGRSAVSVPVAVSCR